MFRILRHSVLEESFWGWLTHFLLSWEAKRKRQVWEEIWGLRGEKGKKVEKSHFFLHTLTWNWSWILQVTLFFWFSDLCAGVLGAGRKGWGWELAVKGKKNKQNLLLDLPATGSTLILTASVSGVDWFLTAGDELTPGIPTFDHLWLYGMGSRQNPLMPRHMLSAAQPQALDSFVLILRSSGWSRARLGSPAKGTHVLSEQKAEAQCHLSSHYTQTLLGKEALGLCEGPASGQITFSLPNTVLTCVLSKSQEALKGTAESTQPPEPKYFLRRSRTGSLALCHYSPQN